MCRASNRSNWDTFVGEPYGDRESISVWVWWNDDRLRERVHVMLPLLVTRTYVSRLKVVKHLDNGASPTR